MRKSWTRSLAALVVSAAALQAAVSYNWKNVVIGGGGFVDGIVFHPTVRGLMYARTDMGGAYRWSPASSSWTPLTDFIGAVSDDMGILSIALDPQDGSKVYLLTGKYSNAWTSEYGKVMVSSDTGRTFRATTLHLKNGGNLDGRGCGERLAVDPNKSGLLFLAGSAWDSSVDGVSKGKFPGALWKSVDGGATFDSVKTSPVGNGTFVLFDPASGTKGSATPVVYMGMDKSDAGAAALWRSKDGGVTWSKIPGAPAALIPCSGSLDGNNAYFSFNNGLGPNGITSGKVMRLDTRTDTWTDVSPVASSTFGYGTVSVDRQNPGHLAVGSVDRWTGGDDVWLSRDGGATWTSRLLEGELDLSFAPWKKTRTPHWLASVQIDPFDSSVALFGTGYGVFRTTNLRATKPVWVAADSNLEECVSKNLVSPPAGAPLVTSVGDQGGWRHAALDRAPAQAHMPDVGTTLSIDVAWGNPAVFVRAHNTKNAAGTTGGISLDSAKTWTNFATQPAGVTIPTEANGWAGTGGGMRAIALNANGSAILWTAPGMTGPYVSHDGGATWTVASGTTLGAYGATPVGDKVNPARFYILDLPNAQILTSTDTGATFTGGAAVIKLDDWEAENAQITTVPGYEGYVMVAADHAWGGGGLYVSTNGGTSARKVANVGSATRVTTGRPAEGKKFPSVFIVGKVGGVYGFFRSDDSLKTWTRINDNQHQFGTIHQIIGDPRVFGRIYIGTEGRGVVYGDDSAASVGVSGGHRKMSHDLIRSGNTVRSVTSGIELCDPTGRTLRTSATRELDLRGLQRGVYFARSSGSFLKVGVLE
jgi:hypothetical protein